MIEFTVPTWASIVSSKKEQYIYIRLFNLFMAKVSDILLYEVTATLLEPRTT